MSETVAHAAGWHPDPDTGGTRYWDGQRWTGDVRPARRPFAAQAAHQGWGIGLIAFGALVVVGPFTQPSTNPVGGVIVGVILIGVGVYLLRGQGPTTKSVVTRLQAERAGSRTANGGPIVVRVEDPSAITTAQINALADPQTAAALQNLQNLLYTRAITDAEYQAAKNKLLGDLTGS